MYIYNILNCLYPLSYNLKLHDENFWGEKENSKEWIQNVKEAIQTAISVIDNQDEKIGTAKFKGKEFFIRKSENDLFPHDQNLLINTARVFENLAHDAHLNSFSFWKEHHKESWCLDTIDYIRYISCLLYSLSFNAVSEIRFFSENYFIFEKNPNKQRRLI